jgi:hypothetical protein
MQAVRNRVGHALAAVARSRFAPWPPEKPPVKTAGSFCPCATTLFDYIRGNGANLDATVRGRWPIP